MLDEENSSGNFREGYRGAQRQREGNLQQGGRIDLGRPNSLTKGLLHAVEIYHIETCFCICFCLLNI